MSGPKGELPGSPPRRSQATPPRPLWSVRAMGLQEVEEIRALRDADTLHMLPPEALIASIKYLAEKVLELLHIDGSGAAP